MALHVARWAERTLAEHQPPLTVTQYLTLEAIANGVTAPGELARRAATSDAAVSQVLRDLEGTGYVERALSAADRRRHEVWLTPAGEAVYASAGDLVTNRIAGLLGELPHPDARRLADLLDFVGHAVGTVAPPRRPTQPPPRL